MNPPVGDIHSGYWELARRYVAVVLTALTVRRINILPAHRTKLQAKLGTAQVFGLKANETYNAHKIAERLRDHKLMTAFAPYNNPQVAVAMILRTVARVRRLVR